MHEAPRLALTPTVVYVGTVVPDTPEFQGPAFSPPGYLFQLNLLKGLSDAGMAIEVLTQRPQQLFPRGSGIWYREGSVELSPGLCARLVPFLNLPVLRPLTVGLWIVRAVYRLARTARPNPVVICTYNLTEPPGLFTLIAARLARVKAVAFMCDVHVPGTLIEDTWARRLDFALQRWLMPRFDGLIVVTDRIAQDFAPSLPYLRVEGGVSSAMLVSGRRSPKREEVFTMVAAGSLHEGNGIAEILAAMRLLRDPRYRLQIAGVGPFEPAVRKAAAEDPRIEYHGLLPFDAVQDLYASADILLNIRVTKKVDTAYFFPSKTMEYFASGVPVITTCPGNIREEYSHLAFLLEDESAEALARTIDQVAAMPREVRERRGRAARDFVSRERTWAVQGCRILEFIRTRIL
jgi:glycosyltransferase involved in cell wall biosynthesis